MKIALAALAAALLVGCGSQSDPVAAPGTGGPDGPPPEIGEGAPPPAWIETESGSFWLAYASYCWGSTCADYVGVSDRDDVPTVRVRRGELVRFHLGFEPSELSLSPASEDRALPQPRLAQVAEWEATEDGGLSLFARAKPGQGGTDASYAVILLFLD